MGAGNNKRGWKAQLLEWLHNPVQLRAFITVFVVVAGYGAIYLPISGDIAQTTADLAKAQKRLDIARDIEHLRTQFNCFKQRLPDKADANEWVQYVLGGIRGFPLKMVALDSQAPRDVGPYKAVVLQIELEGRFVDLHAFVRWLEVNERFFRVDAVSLIPHRKHAGQVTMQLTVLGVMG